MTSLPSSEPAGKRAEGTVSKKMIVVIIALFALILVPTAVLTLPTSRLSVEMVNNNTGDAAHCWLQVYGTSLGSEDFIIAPGDSAATIFFLRPGTYDVHFEYSFVSANYSWWSFTDTVKLSVFETEKIVYEAEVL